MSDSEHPNTPDPSSEQPGQNPRPDPAPQMARQVWVDFNDVDEEGIVGTLIDFAEQGVEPKVGDLIVVGDDEGNLAEGNVHRVERDGLIAVALKPGAFWAADHKPSASA